MRRWTSVCLALLLLALVVAPARAQFVMVWGDDTYGQISEAPVEPVKAVAGGSLQGLALREDGTPILWRTGPAPIGPVEIPASLQTGRYRAIDIARDDAVMLRVDGTLVAFGRNPPLAQVPAGRYRAAAVAAEHALALAQSGRLKAWGAAPDGPRPDLLLVPPGRYKAVDASVWYSLALRVDGTVLAWGYPPAGVLSGWATTPESTKFSYRPGEKYKSIAAGNVHALAIRPDGTVTGWGNNAGGALDAPTHVRFKAVACGWGFSLGLSTDGTLWGWGTPHFLPPAFPFQTRPWTFASEGWTRYGDTQHYYIPDERFTSINAAAFHAMAITASADGADDDDDDCEGDDE